MAQRSFFCFCNVFFKVVPNNSGGEKMLVLTRKIGEEVVIAGNIRVKIVSLKGDKIRLGVSAPDDISVHRSEVQQRVKQQCLLANNGLQE
jgi:carbon storage regulator